MPHISLSPGWLKVPRPNPTNTDLSAAELRALIEMVLELGVMLLEGGADSALTERTLSHIAWMMGCDNLEVLITAGGLVVTVEDVGEFRTKARRVGGFRVHMGKVAAITELAQQMTVKPLTLEELGVEIARIEELGSYPGTLAVPAVAIACGGFSQLFGGAAREFAVATGVVLAVEALRRTLNHRHYHPMLVTVICAALGAGLGLPLSSLAGAASTPVVSAACVPMVPGVLFVNGARDIIKGHIVIGMARGLRALLLVLSIALGVSIAMGIVGRPS